MLQFIIEGGQSLHGEVSISGSKNAALPAMVAALLSDETTRLTNIPDILDVRTQAAIITALGGKAVKIDNHTWEISGRGLNKSEVPKELGQKLRASILFLGVLLSRVGQAKFPHPGGDIIGKRSITTHLEAIKRLGVTIKEGADGFTAETSELYGAYLYLDEVSVTATENALLAAVLAKGVTTIRPAAMEPHVVNLTELLIAMGAKISGVGSHTLVIEGVETLHGSEHAINSDEIETGTFAVAAAITGGEVTLTKVPADLDPIMYTLAKMGVECETYNATLLVKTPTKLSNIKLQVDTWPRFPTDLQPQFTTLATQANGVSTIHEWMYEKRLNYTQDLVRMGANIELVGPHQAIVHGPTPLHGESITTPDIRSGIAFILAALSASGTTTISHAELILRGYEQLVSKLHLLGANIRQTGSLEE